ncbi:hypothetical protein [Streptomyces sp. BH055]|uniref:hypothetical protein n=1 Tax=unclassified Streptomyces TaxID=2593676 RepID=UPI003BB62DBC
MASVMIAAAVMGTSACGGEAEAQKKPASAKPKAMSLDTATAKFQKAVEDFDLVGCESKAPDTCWEQMTAVMKPARDLRKSMNAEKSVGAGFFTEAYALIDTMEDGIGVGQDLGAMVADTNRPKVLGSAHDLAEWLDAHPTK